MGGQSAGLNPYMYNQQQASAGMNPAMPQPQGLSMGQPPGMDIRALVHQLLASRQQGQGIGQMVHGMNPMAQKQQQNFPGVHPLPGVQPTSPISQVSPLPAVYPKTQSSSQTLNPYK